MYVRTSLGCSSEEPHSLKRACRNTVHGTGWKNGAQSLLLGLDVRRTWCLNSAQSLIVHILYEYSYGNLQELRSSFEMLCIIENAGSLGSFLFFLCQLRREKRDRSGNSVIQSLIQLSQTHLPDHLWEVIHIGGAQGLCLEALGLEQVLSDIGGIDEHAMLWPLFVPIGLEHDLQRRAER